MKRNPACLAVSCLLCALLACVPTGSDTIANTTNTDIKVEVVDTTGRRFDFMAKAGTVVGSGGGREKTQYDQVTFLRPDGQPIGTYRRSTISHSLRKFGDTVMIVVYEDGAYPVCQKVLRAQMNRLNSERDAVVFLRQNKDMVRDCYLKHSR